MQLQVIARARNGYTSKFGIPRQSGRAKSVLTHIVFEPEYRVAEALRGIEQFSHLWLLWGFSANEEKAQASWSPTVRPPRLGGNKRVGVFATRSPFRPNNIGLSSVKLERIEHTETEGYVLVVSGADLMDSTPIYDIKPYLPYTDIHQDASGGFASTTDYGVRVEFAEGVKDCLTDDMVTQLTEILREDPRPQYHNDASRVYKFEFYNYNVSFRVNDKLLIVLSIE